MGIAKAIEDKVISDIKHYLSKDISSEIIPDDLQNKMLKVETFPELQKEQASMETKISELWEEFTKFELEGKHDKATKIISEQIHPLQTAIDLIDMKIVDNFTKDMQIEISIDKYEMLVESNRIQLRDGKVFYDNREGNLKYQDGKIIFSPGEMQKIPENIVFKHEKDKELDIGNFNHRNIKIDGLNENVMKNEKEISLEL